MRRTKGIPMSDKALALEPESFWTAMEADDSSAVDREQQFRVVSYVAMAVAAPFIIGHLLIGAFGFPYLTQLFAGKDLPWPTSAMLGIGWLAGPLLVVLEVATFWLIYRLAKRWWIGLLFVPVFIYLMMSAFMGFLFYIPLFPLIRLS
jgi:hypothetical protein